MSESPLPRQEVRWRRYNSLVAAPPRCARGVFFVWCFLLLCTQPGCASGKSEVVVSFVTGQGETTPMITAEIASTVGQRRLGLMYRKKLADNEGMLFVFPGETERSFWMKNTYIELDIIYISSDFRVVSIIHRAVPLSETPRPSGAPAHFVLEVRGGSARAWGIDVGSKLVVQGKLPQPN